MIKASSGLAKAQFFFYDHKTKSFFISENNMPSTRTWYQDSMVIQERLVIRDSIAQPAFHKRWIDTFGYTLIDLRKGWFYHYKTFTDTASLAAKWELSDTTSFYEHGMAWTFYSENKGLMEPAEEPTRLPDTVRQGVRYQRLSFPSADANGKRSHFTVYFRCDKAGTYLQYNKALSRKMGCPMTRYEVIPEGENPFIIAQDIEFVRDGLTAAEEKLFAAWKRNAKKQSGEVSGWSSKSGNDYLNDGCRFIFQSDTRAMNCPRM